MEESERIYTSITMTQLTLTVNIGITIKEYPPFAFTLWRTSNHLSLSCPISFSFFLFPSNLSENSRSGVSKQEKQLVKSKFLLSCKKKNFFFPKQSISPFPLKPWCQPKPRPSISYLLAKVIMDVSTSLHPPPESIHTIKWIQTF